MVLLHNDVDAPFPKPGQDPYQAVQLGALFRRHPKTTIIWAHCGRGRIVRPVADQIGIVARALDDPALAHVFIDISWDEVAKYLVATPETTQAAADLISRHPDRFLFGTDEVAPTEQAKYLKVYDMYGLALREALPRGEREAAKGQLRASLRPGPAPREGLGEGEPQVTTSISPISPITPPAREAGITSTRNDKMTATKGNTGVVGGMLAISLFLVPAFSRAEDKALTTPDAAASAPAAPVQDAKPAAEEKPRMEIYGAAMMDMGYQTGQNDPNWFDVLRPTKLPSFANEYGTDGRYFAGVRQSRLGVKGFIPTSAGEIKTIFEFELFGTGVDAGQTTFRLRHAWGELGQVGAGQT